MGLVRSLRFFLLCLALIHLCACQKRISPPVEKKTRLFTRSGEAVAMSDMTDRLRGADFILIGENHLNICDHSMQAKILAWVAEQRSDVVVGMEMLVSDQQPVLDAYFQGDIALDELEQALDWKNHWGFSFDLYRPIFAVAREKNLRLRALNLPREQIRRMAEGREKVDFPFLAASPEQTEQLREVFKKHRFMLKKKSEARFLKVQALWDSAMAWQAFQASKNRQVVLLAGNGHVENGWGIEYRLRRLRPDANIVRFTPIRSLAELESFRGTNLNLQSAAFFFFCPARSFPL